MRSLIGSRRRPGAVAPLSDWPAPPVHPALAMVTTLGPPGEFQIPPPPAGAPLPCGPGPVHSEGGPALPPTPAAPSLPRPGPQEVGEPGEGARKFCSESGGCCGCESPGCSPLLQHAPNLTPSLPRKVRGLEGVPGTPWLSVSCIGGPAHLGRGPAGSGRPTRRGWAERARGLLRPPPGGPREGRGVSSSLPGGGEGEESAGRGRWGPGGLRTGSDPGRPSWWGGGPKPNFGARGAGRAGGISTERAGPRHRPHPSMGAESRGEGSYGLGAPAGLGFPASGFSLRQ